MVWLMLIFITACGSENQNKTQSPDEGELIVYAGTNSEQAERYLAAFNAEYPSIKVNLFPLSTAVLTERLFSEKENPIADAVFIFGAPRLLLAQWNDILFGYKPAGYERLEPQFRDTVSPPFWVGIQGATNVFCVNPEKIEELGFREPRSWQDLLNPAYKGQIAMPTPKTTSTGYSTIIGFLLFNGESEGWDFMDQLHENITEYTPSSSSPCDMVANGEIAIGITYDDYALTKKKELETAGKSMEVVFPTEGLSWQLYGVGIIKKEQIKPAAKTFLDWTISKSAIDKYAQDYGAVPARTDQAMREGFPKNVNAQLLNMEFPWAAANQDKILTEWSKRYE